MLGYTGVYRVSVDFGKQNEVVTLIVVASISLYSNTLCLALSQARF